MAAAEGSFLHWKNKMNTKMSWGLIERGQH